MMSDAPNSKDDALPLGMFQNGWLSNIEHLPSANFGPRPADTHINLAVIHSISLPPGQYGTGCVQKLFTNQLDWNTHPYFQSIQGLEVSAHFFITREGKAIQFVSCDDRAWHAGKSQWDERENCNDFSIGIELEGLEGERFTAAQYQGLLLLFRSLSEHYPITHITGHEHIAPGRKYDPGPGFEWSTLKMLLQDLELQLPQ